jgi:hypothetical protein
MILGRICLTLMLTLQVGHAVAESFVLDVLETDDLRLLYLAPHQTYLAPHVARSFHNSLEFQRSMFDWVPYEKTTVLLKDFGDYGNAAAGSSPVNTIHMEISPLSRVFESFSANERMYMLMNHELVHVATLDVWNSTDEKWRKFFGGKPSVTKTHPESILYNYLATPRLSSPRWYAEGSAVFMETWMAGGVGRAQGPYDEMVFRSMVRDDAHFYSSVGLVSEGLNVDFMVGVNSYLYGTRFMSYLALNYSPEHVVEWLKRSENSQRYYIKQFEQVFGLAMEAAWDNWIAWEHVFQTANLERVKKFPLTQAEPLTRQALGSVSRSHVDTEDKLLIGGFRYPGVVAHIGAMSLESGEIRPLVDVKGPRLYQVTSTAYDQQSKTLFYTADNTNFRDLMALNVKTGEADMLLENARIGDLVLDQSDRSLWGLRHSDGLVSLVNIPHPYDGWNNVYTWPYGQVPYDIDVSPDGQLLSASISEVNGSQYLRLFETTELMEGKAEGFAQFDFATFIPESFVFSHDGRFLYGSSYYTGISNIFRYEIETRNIEAVSNAETGFFRPIPMEDGSLIVFEFTGEGFLPSKITPTPLEDVSDISFLGAEIARKFPVVKEWAVGSPADIPLDDLVTNQGKYHPEKEIQYDSGYPIMEGYRDYEAFGWYFGFDDPVQLRHLDLTASYSWDDQLPNDERLHVRLDYKSLNWNLSYWHNDADFYDLFGPKKRSRKGDAILFGYKKSLIFDVPRKMSFTADIDYYTGLDELPDFQDVPTFIFKDILQVDLTLDYTHTRKSLGSVDHEKGWRWNVSLLADHAQGNTIPKLRAGLDFGFVLPWKHSSIWLYNSAGTSNGNRLNPLTNYYFGGFQNNYVDEGEVKRYREHYSFPGFEISEVSAKDYFKTVLEWNLPPSRFREAGTSSLFLKHVRPAFFASSLVTDPGKIYERTLTNVGFQVDFELTFVHRLPMVFSVGYAVGYEHSRKHDTEWMFSLKIL